MNLDETANRNGNANFNDAKHGIFVYVRGADLVPLRPPIGRRIFDIDAGTVI